MSDIHIRVAGRAGRITLNRPGALNALTYDMARAIEAALERWRGDDAVALVVIDAAGERAFCAGGDIAELYATGKAGDFGFGRQFWRDEYRLNARLAEYPRPIVSLMQGFTMGGGVGVGCHAAHRVVGEKSRIAMPECGIGLIPDVGGSLILARAPGRLGEYLALCSARMGPGDAILAGFADHYLPEAEWPGLIDRLEETGDARAVAEAARPAPEAALAARRGDIDALFAAGTLQQVAARLDASGGEFATRARAAMARNSPLSMAAALAVIERVRAAPSIRNALTHEYRFTWRAMAEGDFLEGIRAQIIDKDRRPRWRHDLASITPALVGAVTAPLGANELDWED